MLRERNFKCRDGCGDREDVVNLTGAMAPDHLDMMQHTGPYSRVASAQDHTIQRGGGSRAQDHSAWEGRRQDHIMEEGRLRAIPLGEGCSSQRPQGDGGQLPGQYQWAAPQHYPIWGQSQRPDRIVGRGLCPQMG